MRIPAESWQEFSNPASRISTSSRIRHYLACACNVTLCNVLAIVASGVHHISSPVHTWYSGSGWGQIQHHRVASCPHVLQHCTSLVAWVLPWVCRLGNRSRRLQPARAPEAILPEPRMALSQRMSRNLTRFVSGFYFDVDKRCVLVNMAGHDTSLPAVHSDPSGGMHFFLSVLI